MGMSLSLGLDIGGPLVGKWGGASPDPTNVELREDGSYELREDGSIEIREDDA